MKNLLSSSFDGNSLPQTILKRIATLQYYPILRLPITSSVIMADQAAERVIPSSSVSFKEASGPEKKRPSSESRFEEDTPLPSDLLLKLKGRLGEMAYS